VEVVLAYVAVGVLLVAQPRSTHFERLFFLLSAVAALFLGVRLALTPAGLVATGIIFTNHTFSLLSICLFLVFFRQLSSVRRLLIPLWLVSLFANGMALIQWLFPQSWINGIIFDGYGGTYGRRHLIADSYAEFLIEYAGRYTGIFNGMHALGLFNVLVIGLTIAHLSGGRIRLTPTNCLAALGFLGCIVGGILSASKTFYFGTAAMMATLLLIRRLKIVHLLWLAPLAGAAAAFTLKTAERKSAISNYFNAFASMDFSGVMTSRYGESGYLTKTLNLMAADPATVFVGRGAETGQISLADSAYISPVVLAGIPFFVFFFAPILYLLRANFLRMREADWWCGVMFAVLLTVLIIGVGIPTLQHGRITMFVLVVNLVILRTESQVQTRGAPLSTANNN